MELKTRCPECETVFSVALEQLQLRKGYIRCIQCAHIFDGFDAVVPGEVTKPAATGVVIPKEPTLSPVSPDAASERESTGTPQPIFVPGTSTTQVSGPAFVVPPPGSDVADSGAAPMRPFSVGPGPGEFKGREPAQEHVISVGRATTARHTASSHEPRLPSVVRERGAYVPVRPDDDEDARLDQEPATDFLFVEPRDARRSERQSPNFLNEPRRGRGAMAVIWSVLALVGLVLLLAQGVFVYRSQLANAFPGLRPLLVEACDRIGCTVAYDRDINSIAITGSALRAGAASENDVSQLTLEVTMRNAHERPQEWPTLVLDLKDASGTVVVRRNLPPALWVPAEIRDGPFPAGQQLTVHVPVAVRGLQANGYQLDKFFP